MNFEDQVEKTLSDWATVETNLLGEIDFDLVKNSIAIGNAIERMRYSGVSESARSPDYWNVISHGMGCRRLLANELHGKEFLTDDEFAAIAALEECEVESQSSFAS